jgi:hypothetical protein
MKNLKEHTTRLFALQLMSLIARDGKYYDAAHFLVILMGDKGQDAGLGREFFIDSCMARLTKADEPEWNKADEPQLKKELTECTRHLTWNECGLISLHLTRIFHQVWQEIDADIKAAEGK